MSQAILKESADALTILLSQIKTELKKAPYTLPVEGPVSPAQVARWLECSDRTVYRLVAEGVLPRIHRIGVTKMKSGGLARMDATECWDKYRQYIEANTQK